MSEPIEPADCLEAVKQQGAREALVSIKYEFTCIRGSYQKIYDVSESFSEKRNMKYRISAWNEAIQIVEEKLSQYPKYETEGDTTDDGTA